MPRHTSSFARWFGVAGIVAVLAALVLTAVDAHAADAPAAGSVPAVPFVAGAYGFIWAAVLVYVIFIVRRLGRVQSEIDDLRRKLDGGARS